MSNTFTSVQEIDMELENLEKKLSNVVGRPTEVYTRIVGYHRDVSNWNKGKKEEYFDRKTFLIDNNLNDSPLDNKETILAKDELYVIKDGCVNSNKASYYKFFYTNKCVNCPPVKEYIKNISMKGESIDATLELGLFEARKYDIMSTPTVIFFDENDNIIFIAHNKADLEKFLGN